MSIGTLHLFCGKIAAGKSTLAAQIAADNRAVFLAEDVWVGTLFPDNSTPREFIKSSNKLRRVVGPHIVDLLQKGLTVVLDFQANTVESRAWMQSLIAKSGADHQLHLLLLSDKVCLERLHLRNTAGDDPLTVTEAQFHQISAHFVPPKAEENFNIVTYENERLNLP